MAQVDHGGKCGLAEIKIGDLADSHKRLIEMGLVCHLSLPSHRRSTTSIIAETTAAAAATHAAFFALRGTRLSSCPKPVAEK